MSEAVQLVMVFQVCKYFIFPVQDIISIQVSVLLLGGTDDINGMVRCLFQLRVRVLGEEYPAASIHL